MRLQSSSEASVVVDSEMKALQQQNHELQLRLSRHEQQTDSTFQDGETVTSLQELVAQLRSDVTASEQREAECMRNLDALRVESAQSKRALAEAEQVRVAMEENLAGADHELSRLRKQLAARERDRETFADFVQLKRDAQALQRENELLRSKIKPRTVKKPKPADVSTSAVAAHPSQSLPSLNYNPTTTTYKRLDSGGLARAKQLPAYALLPSS